VGHKVLVVDDALYMRAVLKNVLSTAGYSVVEAANGRLAVEAYAGERPDIVMMDITMPELDGISATRQICATDPSARVIICSALGQQQMVMDALDAGAKDYITKPFQPDQVVQTVQRNLSA
jgi:two-component system, chemotaxis family, chemotaxis protein CheY